jgi:hypothetical protein
METVRERNLFIVVYRDGKEFRFLLERPCVFSTVPWLMTARDWISGSAVILSKESQIGFRMDSLATLISSPSGFPW